MSATLTAVFSDPKSDANISEAGVLINNKADGLGACYVLHIPPGNALSLVKDPGSDVDVLDLTKGGSVSNSQCLLESTGSSISSTGNELTLTLHLTFRPGFAGQKNIYLYAENKDGGKANIQIKKGAWDIR